MKKGQSSVEYLATWAFAIFILGLNITLLYQMGIIDLSIDTLITAETISLRIGDLVVQEFYISSSGDYAFAFENFGRDSIRMDEISLGSIDSYPSETLEPGETYIWNGTGYPSGQKGVYYETPLVVNYTDLETGSTHYFNRMIRSKYT